MSDFERRRQLRALQSVQLELLVEFDRICRKHHLNYQLFAGSLLGCVRHHGFIPWDDDVDVCLLREDYDRFCRLAKDELDPSIFLQTPSSDPGYLLQFAKLRRNDSKMVEQSMIHRPQHHGIFIDIFPLDKLPRSVFAQNLQRIFLETLRLVELARVAEILSQSKRIPQRWVPFVSFVCGFIPKRMLDGMQAWGSTFFNASDSKLRSHFTNGVTRHRLKRFTRLQESCESSVEADFEGHRFFIPKDADDVLKMMYGDYMRLPALEQRGSAHRIVELKLPDQQEAKPYRVGYTAGVFDLFHEGHRRHLENARALCDVLIVGVNSDELTMSYKPIRPCENQNVRIRNIMESGYADQVVLV
ncbi:MAG: LicD family protein, partial [Erysipelotrichaceae bacterium]|nr:LicD family protein [Erysipelotrichaceae bacterium]